jgi:hypothetical protein
MFGPKGDEVRGEWTRQELYDLYSSPNVIRTTKSRGMRCAVYVARAGDGNGTYRLAVGRYEGKRSPGRSRRRWEKY